MGKEEGQEGAGGEGVAGREVNEGERGRKAEGDEKCAAMAEAARRAGEPGVEAEAGAGRRGRAVRGGWEAGGCRETGGEGLSAARSPLTYPARTVFPLAKNLSAFIGAAVTLLIGY